MRPRAFAAGPHDHRRWPARNPAIAGKSKAGRLPALAAWSSDVRWCHRRLESRCILEPGSLPRPTPLDLDRRSPRRSLSRGGAIPQREHLLPKQHLPRMSELQDVLRCQRASSRPRIQGCRWEWPPASDAVEKRRNVWPRSARPRQRPDELLETIPLRCCPDFSMGVAKRTNERRYTGGVSMSLAINTSR